VDEKEEIMTRRTLGLAVALSVGLSAMAAAQAHTKETQATMTPAKSLDALKEGNARFLAGKQKPRNLKAEVAATAAGQYPFAAVVSCMDSRAPVEIILDQGIGDLFSLRVAGNVIEGDFLGSLEYAAKVVGVKLIVVMGHTNCGAVKGAVDDVKLGNLTALLAQIEPAIVAVGPPRGTSKDHAYVEKVAEANVRNSMKQIHTKSPVLEEMLKSGQLGLVGAMYDVETGKTTFYAD
jgi:carbonic anhydrase